MLREELPVSIQMFDDLYPSPCPARALTWLRPLVVVDIVLRMSELSSKYLRYLPWWNLSA
jgi:hypothetical protein